MSADEKVVFEDKSKQDHALHDARLKQREQHGYFLFEDGTKSTDPANADRVQKIKKVKAKDDHSDGETYREAKPVEPKGVKSPYNIFISEYQAPEGTANMDRMRLAAEAFKTLPADQKARLEELTLKDKARRDEQLKMLNSKGYFLLADGTKSIDAK